MSADGGPRPVGGRFRRLRWAADGILIAILLVVPWIRVGGEPLVLLDVPGRKFHVFGLVIFPQELYFLWLILAALALALFFFTALAGRLWCGWACPQTVLTDVFSLVARRIEGWSRTGPPARVAPARRIATHAVWLALSFVLGFHLVAYFVSPYAMLDEVRAGALSPTVAGFLVATSVLVYLDLAWVRQTFCKLICPYARFQGVLFDRDTLVVGYDALRGEPRGKRAAGRGDCVDCGLCVAVCPTGIDIRNGLQMECVACLQCVDACDEIMTKVKRPTGLIGFASHNELAGQGRRVVRPRLLVYSVLTILAASALGVSLWTRTPFESNVIRTKGSNPFVIDGEMIRNPFEIHLVNKNPEPSTFKLAITAPVPVEVVLGQTEPVLASLTDTRVPVMISIRSELVKGPIELTLEITDSASGTVKRQPIKFLSPMSVGR